MALSPLTHHQILDVVAPFARCGLHVDLPASDRMARRIAFRPVEHPASPADGLPALPAVTEVLQLENPGEGRWRLTRQLTLRHDDPAHPQPVGAGLRAELVTEGSEVPALLARVQAVPWQRHLATGPGYCLARSHKLLAGAAGHENHMLILTHGEARFEGLVMKLRVSPVKGIAGEIELIASGPGTLALPEDLLAVLGWDWARLVQTGAGWSTRLRLRGGGTDRGRDAEAKFDRGALHLARTLAEPPALFHDKQVAARWRVVVRRALPLIGGVAMMAGAGLVAKMDLAQDSLLRMLIFHSPPILLMLFFCLNELPRVEIPPLPRRPLMASWRVPEPQPAR